ncbi:peptidase E [Pradoshia eiseniae]|uniref:Peptidase E n=1 Tax=Pradoshia eiseniae TaxID=2064768 RepID=A0A2S7MV99_9BACI|nr:Type 1 glutamine amidotransferase-like domain-containing protein [Pradoshia eiseniae]PQD93714.1 peptidase E [Pradoshia eiseniae]
MSKFFLTSNGFSTEEIKAAFLKNLYDTPNKLKAAIITTASPLKERNKYAQKAMDDFKTMGFMFIDFVDLEYDNPAILFDYDVIYINGGNPFHLLLHIQMSGSEEIFKHLSKQKTVFVGFSAGAMILGPHIQLARFFTPRMNSLNLQDLSCLPLLDTIVFPHYDREDLFKDDSGKTIEERLSEFEKSHHCMVHRLKDNQFTLLEA